MGPPPSETHRVPQHSLSDVHSSPSGRHRSAGTPSHVPLRQLSLQQSMLFWHASPADAQSGPAAQTRAPSATFGHDRWQQAPAALHWTPSARQPVVGGPIEGSMSGSTRGSMSGSRTGSMSGSTAGSREESISGSTVESVGRASSRTLASTPASRGASTLTDSPPQANACAATRAGGRRPRTRDIVRDFTRLEAQG